MSEDAVQTIDFDMTEIVYTFTHSCLLADLSALTDKQRDTLAADYWLSPDKTGPGWANAKMLTKDADDETALVAALAALSITAKSIVNIGLTTQEQADTEASGINQKNMLPSYLSRCAALRTDNPTWTDATVRSVARA